MHNSSNCIEIYSDFTVFVSFDLYSCAVPLTNLFLFFLFLCYVGGFCVFHLWQLLSSVCNGIIKKKVGIKPSVLRSIPVVDFNPPAFRYGVECVFCLSEFVDRDKIRILPNCNHCFHVVCIDRWFQLYSTCPIYSKRVGMRHNLAATTTRVWLKITTVVTHYTNLGKL
ncbi:hypothetical protein ARALYDRAFT_900366 [Arabidopsis lyrata subsp. lyrata]|uniref:RING-type E3 ubiquitin transferase n=1 Tax=Arabidopsis lyrata subsp. lyrata TaxID=81972 RepID=D7L2U0_ARALL|nr:hypothetical protein ARALYDRAFT_900366 [Arabidopsis lyrata subsp. lyrata]